MATNSRILPWKIPWTEEPGKLQSMGSQRVGHNLATKQLQTMPFAAIQMDLKIITGFPGDANEKQPICQHRRHRRHSFILGLEKSPGGGHGNPLQYSCLENPMDRGAWWATVHEVAKSRT